MFCLDTGARPEAVDAAVTRTGARLVRQGLFGGAPTKMWEHTRREHRISVWISDTSSLGKVARRSALCTITDFQDNGESVPSLRDWLGRRGSASGLQPYAFRLEAGRPTPMEDGFGAIGQDQSSRRSYRLRIFHPRSSTMTGLIFAAMDGEAGDIQRERP
jgi:hypothetical protein